MRTVLKSVVCVAGLATLAAPAPRALAADAENQSGYVSYEREQYRAVPNAGSKLKWVPYKNKQLRETAVKQTQYLAAEEQAEESSRGVIRVAANQSQALDPVPNEPGELPGSVKPTPRRSANDDLFSPSGSNGLNHKTAELKFNCPSMKSLKPIKDLTTKVSLGDGEVPQDCPWGDDDFKSRCWQGTTFTWTASALCHKPLYFEDTQLERYGHGFGPWLQPFASGANFFIRFPILPYEMGLEPPNECIYDLGYYRPGSCAPYLIDGVPLSLRAAAFEAGAVAGAAAVLP